MFWWDVGRHPASRAASKSQIIHNSVDVEVHSLALARYLLQEQECSGLAEWRLRHQPGTPAVHTWGACSLNLSCCTNLKSHCQAAIHDWV